MRRALTGGAVAEEGDCGLARLMERRGQRRSAGVRQAGADDAVAAEDLEREVGDVHRAAEPVAVSRPLSEHLGHHPAEVGAGRDQVAVRAVMANEVVGVAHDAGGADGDCLLPDAAVRRPEDDALLEQLRGAILEAPDQSHQAVLLEERRPVGGPLRHDGCLETHTANVLRMIEDRVVLVTGAASGIGREIAERFGREGARVTGFDLAGDVAIHGDVRFPVEVERAVDHVVSGRGAHRHPREQRRCPRDRRRLHDGERGVGQRDRGQPERHVLLLPGRRAADARGRWGRDREHLVRRGSDRSRATSRVHGGEARGDRPDEEPGPRPRPSRDPRQRDLPGPDQDAVDRTVFRRRCLRGRLAYNRPSGPSGCPRRRRGRRPLPRERPVGVRQRHGAHRRRRLAGGKELCGQRGR